MIQILRLPLTVLGIVCFAGCLPPDTLAISTDEGERAYFELQDSNFNVNLEHIRPWFSKHQKEITAAVNVLNKTSDSLQLICSKWLICSKNDTFMWRASPDPRYDLSSVDSVTLAPGVADRVNLYFVGNKRYSRRMFNKSNKRDTLYLHLNLCDKDIRTLPMRNHHQGFIWNTY